MSTTRMPDSAPCRIPLVRNPNMSAEVVDLRSIQPLDEETILTSVIKTSRLVIAHEAPVRGGFGGEVAGIAFFAVGTGVTELHRRADQWFGLP